MRDVIEKTADKVGSTAYAHDGDHPNGTWNRKMGYGRIDARDAVEEAALTFVGQLDQLMGYEAGIRDLRDLVEAPGGRRARPAATSPRRPGTARRAQPAPGRRQPTARHPEPRRCKACFLPPRPRRLPSGRILRVVGL